MAEEGGEETGERKPLDGCLSLFLTGTTLKLVGIEDMGDNLLSKKIDKETLLHDIQFRGAISDFHVVKSKIQKANYDPLIIRYNHDDRYGDGNNFELCCSKASADVWEEEDRAAAQALLDAADAAARAALEAEEAKKFKSKKKKRRPPADWVSLGSEAEIEETQAKPTRELLVVAFARKRQDFGGKYKLNDKDAQELWNSSQMECRPFKDPNFELKHMEHDIGIQAIAFRHNVSIQATHNMLRNSTTQYAPNGMEEEELKAHMQDPGMLEFLDTVTAGYEHALQQNEVMDIFEDDFASLAEEDSAPGHKSANFISEFQSFTDLTYSKGKKVSAIEWVPKRKGVVAVACTERKTSDERIKNAGRVVQSAILVWNFKDPIHPQFLLESPFDVLAFMFNPRRPEIVAGGLYNGQVILWNTASVQAQMKKKEKKKDGEEGETAVPVVKPALLSAVENSHTRAITDLIWLPDGVDIGKMGKVVQNETQDVNTFVTTADDGKVLFWDIRVKRNPKTYELIWTPTHKITLTRIDIAGDLSAIKFSFRMGTGNMKGLQTLFYATSMEGEVAVADFERPADVDHPEFTKTLYTHHSGPVVALQRSPFFEDLLLSVGDWTFKVWKEGIHTPLFSSQFADTYLSTGCWSPTRPAVIYTAKMDGTLEVWDLLDRSHEASMLATITSSQITSMAFWPETNKTQQLLAIGNSQGVLHIMEMPRNLRRPVPNEKAVTKAFFDREQARVEYVKMRKGVRDAELKEKEAAKLAEQAAAQAAEESNSKSANDAQKVDEQMEAEYRKLEHEFKVQLGLISEEEAGA